MLKSYQVKIKRIKSNGGSDKIPLPYMTPDIVAITPENAIETAVQRVYGRLRGYYDESANVRITRSENILAVFDRDNDILEWKVVTIEPI